MGLVRMLPWAVVVSAALAAVPNGARACAVGGGPVAGYAVGSGFTLGWELAGTLPCTPLTHYVIGGSYRLSPGDGPAMHHYIAWEPWLVIGATLGASIDDGGRPAAVLGGWEAVPILVESTRMQEAYESVPAWMVSFAIGLRTLGAGLEIYVAPKLQWVARPDVFT